MKYRIYLNVEGKVSIKDVQTLEEMQTYQLLEYADDLVCIDEYKAYAINRDGNRIGNFEIVDVLSLPGPKCEVLFKDIQGVAYSKEYKRWEKNAFDDALQLLRKLNEYGASWKAYHDSLELTQLRKENQELNRLLLNK